MSNVNLIWVTPDAEKLVLYMARVSSNDQESTDTRLLNYLIKHQHWSPFEMVNMCVELHTTRDISAQIIRHRSFSFQEFSQRYAEATEIVRTMPRRQDIKNRQNSINDLPIETHDWWARAQSKLIREIEYIYNTALKKGIAKESARRLLPMATATKIYMNGSVRSWIHYFELRCHESTQLEHREVATQIKEVFKEEFPIISEALGYT